MSVARLHHRSYFWRGGTEWLAEVGEGRTILFIPPLLEEMNRCRAFMVAIMRVVADAGFRAVLPDLPGTGESSRDLFDVSWEDWTGAPESLRLDSNSGDQTPLLATFRGGCLLEPAFVGVDVWRFAPVAGGALVRDLIRSKAASAPAKTPTAEIERAARAEGGEFAGYMIPPAIFTALIDAPLPIALARIVRLTSDPGEAALKVDGRPLWRQAEPGIDPALSDALGRDIAAWANACVG